MKYLTYNDDIKLVYSLNICCCGTTDECYNWLIEYLKDLKEQNYDKYSYDNENWKLIQIINGFLEEKEFVEHGCTCRCSWLTETGEKLLETLIKLKRHNFNFNPDYNTEYGKWFWKEEE